MRLSLFRNAHIRRQHVAVKQHTVDSVHSFSVTGSRALWEFDYLESKEERDYLQSVLSSPFQMDRSTMEQLATIMLQSETFDAFMAKRFGQVKRYGLEGGEGMMVAMRELLLSNSAVIGMPHRGRLNLLTGLLGYPLEAMFAKLKGRPELPKNIPGTGDVLSHLWLDRTDNDGRRHILLPNPSHLEAVNAVHLGIARHVPDCLPVQIHGDAAFAAQGIVQEALMLSLLPGFRVNGCIHVVVNNQIGFTTPVSSARSTKHPSDPLRMMQAPVFHVPGGDPVEIARAARAALQYRNKFGKDVGIDIVCYRRMGHNELDEPAFTQPVMYSAIRSSDLPGTAFAKSIQLVPFI